MKKMNGYVTNYTLSLLILKFYDKNINIKIMIYIRLILYI